MADRLAGKVAIVTGAGSSGPGVGNGKAASILFAREGARVLLVDRELDRAEETLRLIEEEGGTASAMGADVTSAADCEAMVRTAVDRYGRLDVVHNNVGISTRANVTDVTEEQWDHIMAVNVKSIVLTSRYAIPEMKKGGGGSIITLSSIAGLRANSSTPYTTSKAAVVGLTQSMAGDHGARRHPRQLHRPWPRLHPHGRAPHGTTTCARYGARPECSAPRAPRGTSAGPPSSSPATRLAGSRGSSFPSTPACSSPPPSPTTASASSSTAAPASTRAGSPLSLWERSTRLRGG